MTPSNYTADKKGYKAYVKDAGGEMNAITFAQFLSLPRVQQGVCEIAETALENAYKRAAFSNVVNIETECPNLWAEIGFLVNVVSAFAEVEGFTSEELKALYTRRAISLCPKNNALCADILNSLIN